MNSVTRNLREEDGRMIWHPYSQHGMKLPVLPVVSGKGAYLKLENGKEVLDGISSWWVNLHGHSHPRIAEAVHRQALQLEHVIFAGFTHRPAVELAQLLLEYPSVNRADFSRVFYSDNGSTAVEVALKMAFQYHVNSGHRDRTRFIALSQSYHGDTLGAMAVCEPSGFHALFQPLLPKVDFVEPGNMDQFRRLIRENDHSYAAFIFEPLVQGAGGMRTYPPEFLKEAVELCRSHEILTIADEVFTGFFRTGACFAFEIAGIRPDFLCLSKGITGGFLPLAVTLTHEKVFSSFSSSEMKHAFLHGHSYTANPIACAAGIESWKILQSPECRSQIASIERRTRFHIENLKKHHEVQAARSVGTIGAIELNRPMTYFSSRPGKYLQMALEKGVLLRPLGNVLYAVPPYCCTEKEIDRIYEVMTELAEYKE